MGPLGCADAAEPRLLVRKLPMKEEAGGFPIRRLLAVCEAIGSGDGKYFPGWKCAAGCAAGPAGARRAAAAALRWPRLPRSDSK